MKFYKSLLYKKAFTKTDLKSELKKYNYKDLQKLCKGTGINAFNKKETIYKELKDKGVIK